MAYTAGPGLIGALLVGASCARALAWSLEVPAIGVHHMEGHLLAPLLEADPPEPPFVALLVSGGHSMLIEVSAIGRYRLLGDTLDDAAGEAFDKTAKLMGLPYPGGPALAKLAESGHEGRFTFSRPMTDRPGLDFSFSGLKTQVLLAYQSNAEKPDAKADIATAVHVNHRRIVFRNIHHIRRHRNDLDLTAIIDDILLRRGLRIRRRSL